MRSTRPRRPPSRRPSGPSTNHRTHPLPSCAAVRVPFPRALTSRPSHPERPTESPRRAVGNGEGDPFGGTGVGGGVAAPTDDGYVTTPASRAPARMAAANALGAALHTAAGSAVRDRIATEIG